MDVTRPGAAVQCSVRGGASHVYSGLLILYEPTRFILYTAPNPDSCSKLKLRWLFIAQHISPPAVPNGHPTLTRVTPHPHQYPGVSLATAMDNMITVAQRHGQGFNIYSLAYFWHHCCVSDDTPLYPCIKRFQILDSHLEKAAVNARFISFHFCISHL